MGQMNYIPAGEAVIIVKLLIIFKLGEIGGQVSGFPPSLRWAGRFQVSLGFLHPASDTRRFAGFGFRPLILIVPLAKGDVEVEVGEIVVLVAESHNGDWDGKTIDQKANFQRFNAGVILAKIKIQPCFYI